MLRRRVLLLLLCLHPFFVLFVFVFVFFGFLLCLCRRCRRDRRRLLQPRRPLRCKRLLRSLLQRRAVVGVCDGRVQAAVAGSGDTAAAANRPGDAPRLHTVPEVSGRRRLVGWTRRELRRRVAARLVQRLRRRPVVAATDPPHTADTTVVETLVEVGSRRQRRRRRVVPARPKAQDVVAQRVRRLAVQRHPVVPHRVVVAEGAGVPAGGRRGGGGRRGTGATVRLADQRQKRVDEQAAVAGGDEEVEVVCVEAEAQQGVVELEEGVDALVRHAADDAAVLVAQVQRRPREHHHRHVRRCVQVLVVQRLREEEDVLVREAALERTPVLLRDRRVPIDTALPFAHHAHPFKLHRLDRGRRQRRLRQRRRLLLLLLPLPHRLLRRCHRRGGHGRRRRLGRRTILLIVGSDGGIGTAASSASSASTLRHAIVVLAFHHHHRLDRCARRRRARCVLHRRQRLQRRRSLLRRGRHRRSTPRQQRHRRLAPPLSDAAPVRRHEVGLVAADVAVEHEQQPRHDAGGGADGPGVDGPHPEPVVVVGVLKAQRVRDRREAQVEHDGPLRRRLVVAAHGHLRLAPPRLQPSPVRLHQVVLRVDRCAVERLEQTRRRHTRTRHHAARRHLRHRHAVGVRPVRDAQRIVQLCEAQLVHCRCSRLLLLLRG
eukprot:Rhum_TRINITY_DN14544_c6_g1::Rhum_TRINITY_DN14544_c6_g1_i1::g.94828::m.94828